MKPETETKAESSSRREPKYRGVRKRKWGKWVSEIRMPNSRERIWLGSYDSPVKAARAFDAATYCLRGHAAKLNFPDQPPNIPGATSLSSLEIQAAAARFANETPDEVVVPMQQEPPISASASASASASEMTTSLVNLHDDINNNNVMDYDIFPGFDDYFMQPPPMVPNQFPNDDDQNSDDGDISQGPSFLWNY